MTYELNLFCFGTNLFITIFCGAFLAVIPTLTRRAFLFGVKVPESAHDHPEVRSMKKQYVMIVGCGMLTMLTLNIIQYIFWPDATLLATMYFPLLLIAVQTAAFIPNWKKAVRLKSENNWSVPGTVFAESRSAHSRGNLSAIPWGYYIAPLVLIFISIAVSLMKYPSLPDSLPTHFDINMNPDAWSPKSLWVVLSLQLINISTVLLMAAANILVVKAKLQVSPQDPALSFAQHRQYRKLMGHGLGILTLGMAIGFVIIGAMTLWPEFRISFGLLMAILLLPCVPMIIIPFYTGQGGCRLKPRMSKTDTPSVGYHPGTGQNTRVPGRDDDKYWILGMFYYNPDDPALLVEHRFGVNIGFNYARQGVIAGVVIVTLASIAMYVWITIRLSAMI